MSRLYYMLDSDSRQNLVTSCGHMKGELTIRYGSAYDSKVALHVRVDYPKGAETPTLIITKYVD